ncbi:sensor histidine kinase [Streptomyces tsukubensis]|uniref:histidine kinase n=1 Tax=Streptomyces tsukubensis TaxID=83656 RepID=A0A1V4AEL5_9ACTN|nr:sensor histidine kinase [Streptomyces tsukubensis]OON82534.1 histidine kinase [Streptomyces tsukubensis]QFR92303.1 HAMP domain-containing protein [Streptomyces tsukubensis]
MTSPSGPSRTSIAPLTARLSVQGWIHSVLALMAVLVLVCAVVGVRLQATTDDRTSDLVDHIQPASSASFKLQKALLDQETGVRGYALTANKDFLQPYEQGQRDETRLRGVVRGYVTEYPVLRADLDAIRDAAAQWRKTQARPVIASVRERRAAAATGGLDESKRSFDRLRALFGKQDDHLTDAREKARADLADTRRLRNWAFGAMLVLLIAGGLTLTVVLRRMVGRPLRKLEKGAERVSGGDFEQTIGMEGPRDVQALGRAVEGMRRKITAELSASMSRERLLAERTADLDAQTAELQRSNAELEQFAYVASHDLQEPLRKIASFCQLLEKRYGDELDDRAKQYIAFAVDGAKRMQVLINDLLTFSRVGRLGGEPAPVPLDDVLDRALADLALALEESGTTFERKGPLPVVTGDRTTLALLWQNLVGNAVKFRHPDRSPVITVDCRREGDFWQVSVTDNGIGVPEEFGEKVFVIFQRLHSREEYGGTGIGLALCRKIVEHHGGRIGFDHSVPEGTRITFTLPVLDEPDTSGGTEPPAADSVPGQAHATGDEDTTPGVTTKAADATQLGATR